MVEGMAEGAFAAVRFAGADGGGLNLLLLSFRSKQCGPGQQVEQFLDRHAFATAGCATDQHVIGLCLAKQGHAGQGEVIREPGSADQRYDSLDGSQRRPADVLIFGRRSAALAQEEGCSDRPTDGQKEPEKHTFLDSSADDLVAAPCIEADLILGHLDARAAAVRIGKIRDPAAEPEAVPNVVYPQPSVERGGSLNEPETSCHST